MSGTKLKIGILLDSSELPAWAYYSLEKVAKSEGAEIALVILNRENPGPRRKANEIREDKGKIVNTLYSRIDRAFFYREPDAFRLMNALELAPAVPTMGVKSTRERNSISFRPADVEQIESFGLDVLVYFGPGRLQGNILNAAKYGIWSYRHGRRIGNGGGPAGFEEVLQKETETEVILHRLRESSEIGEILYRSSFPTFPFSPWRNRGCCYWGSSPFLSRQIEALQRLGGKRFFDEVRRLNDDFSKTEPSPDRISPRRSLIGSIIHLMGNIIRELFQRKFYWPTWHLLYDLKNSDLGTFAHWKPMLPPKDRFWADPHIIQVNDMYYIFVEEYIYQKGKGRISVIEMDSQGSYKTQFPSWKGNFISLTLLFSDGMGNIS